MSHQAKYDARAWETLQMTFVASFYCVAGIDGNVDKKEVEAFAKELMEFHLYKNALVREVLASTSANLGSLVESFQVNRIFEYFNEAADVLDRTASAEDADSFKRVVIAVCLKVAEASGGGFLGMGDKVSKDEKAAIAAIAISLRFKP